MRRKLFAGAVLVAALMTIGAGSAQAGGTLSVHVLSNRADLISGGEALASVGFSSGVNPATLKVTLNGANVTRCARTAATRAWSPVCIWVATCSKPKHAARRAPR